MALPLDFDWRAYLIRYPDLRGAGVRTKVSGRPPPPPTHTHTHSNAATAPATARACAPAAGAKHGTSS